MAKSAPIRADTQLTMQVVNYISRLIEKGSLRPGDKIPPEREFASKLKMSRASLRAGIGYLAAMGVLRVRHGVGAFVSEGPPVLGSASLPLLGVLHGFKNWQMFEARRILEQNLAELAAMRGTEEQLAALAEEVAEMYATVDEPAKYLIHDVRFHRTIAEAAGNPILAVLMETITAALYETRRLRVERSLQLKESAALHHRIYKDIRARDGVAARKSMERHLKLAEGAQKIEEAAAIQKKAARTKVRPASASAKPKRS